MPRLMVAQVSRPDNGWLSEGACANKHGPRSWKLAGELIERGHGSGMLPRWTESGGKGR